MDNLIKNRKVQIIAVGTLLILATWLVLNYLESHSDKTPEFSVKTAKLQDSQVPVNIPKDLPMEPGSDILQNYESRTNDGRTQSTIIFTSSKDLRGALNQFMEFFKKKGFNGQVDEASSQSEKQDLAQLSKDNQMIVIVTRPYRKNQTSVEVTLTQYPQ